MTYQQAFVKYVKERGFSLLDVGENGRGERSLMEKMPCCRNDSLTLM